MTGTTPLYGIPYLADGDTLADLPETLEAQAEAVESALAGFGGIAAPGSWHDVGGSGEPAFATHFGNYGSGYQPLQFRKVGQAVYLRGVILRSVDDSLANAVLFTLPSGHRPPAHVVFPAEGPAGTLNMVTVQDDGQVKFAGNLSSGETASIVSPPLWID